MNSIEAYNLMHQGTIALARAERAGMRVDVEYLHNKIAHLTRRIDRLEGKIKDSDFYKKWEKYQGKEPNPNSSVQLSNFLYGKLGLKPPKETETGRGSTDKESLQFLNIPELNSLLEIRKLKKIRDTYLEGFLREEVDGWLHPNFNLHLVTTFRSSSDKPNFQNIPKRDKEAMQITRRALYPREGHQLLEVDYSGLEVRIAACYHQDPTMLKYLRDGFDMHGDMTKQIFLLSDFDKHREDHSYLRAATKNGFVFPEFYGDYFRNCAEYMACNWCELPKGKWKAESGVKLGQSTIGRHMILKGIKSLKDFEDHLEKIENDFWTKRFPHYARWKEKWWKQYQRLGYVDMLTGFRCSGLMSKNDAINYPVQGAAFHCLLWSLIHIDKMLIDSKWRTRIIGQIHDSIILDVHPPELPMLVKHIKHIATEELPKAWDWIIVPLEVDFEYCDVDASWADKKELKIN